MIKFGPSGNCISFYNDGFKRSYEAPIWLNEKMGLNAYEYSFGRGINLGDETAILIGQQAKIYNIEVSVHAPYYINFATDDENNAIKSYDYVLNSLKKLRLMGGNRVVVHVGSVGKKSREQAIQLISNRLTILCKLLKTEGFSDMLICLEAMGKPAQIGTYQEIFELCKICENFIPTLDFGHINALTLGSLKTEQDFAKIIELMIKELGYEKARKVHIHFSKIEYGAKGEIRHLTLDDNIYGPNFEPLAIVLKKYKIDQATVISESQQQMGIDAKRLKEIYENTSSLN